MWSGVGKEGGYGTEEPATQFWNPDSMKGNSGPSVAGAGASHSEPSKIMMKRKGVRRARSALPYPGGGMKGQLK